MFKDPRNPWEVRSKARFETLEHVLRPRVPEEMTPPRPHATFAERERPASLAYFTPLAYKTRTLLLADLLDPGRTRPSSQAAGPQALPSPQLPQKDYEIPPKLTGQGQIVSESLRCNEKAKRGNIETVGRPDGRKTQEMRLRASRTTPAAGAVFRENRRLNAERYRREDNARSPCQRILWRGDAPRKPRSSSSIVPRDSKGRRLDPPLNPPSPGIVTEVEKAKYCNQYHLKEFCQFDRRQCKFRHEARDERGHFRRLNPEEKEALRCLARRSFCVKRTSCDDPDCFASHRCSNHDKKPEGRRCSFPASMHFEDSEPVNLPKEQRWTLR